MRDASNWSALDRRGSSTDAAVEPGFAPADGIALWTKGLFIATGLVAAVGAVSGLMQFDLLARAAAHGITEAGAAANDSRQQLIAGLGFLLYLGTAVTFLVWFHRVHRNLLSLGNQRLTYTPGWAVGGFFVPFLNLVRPFQVMREVWNGSDPSGISHGGAISDLSSWRQSGTPALVGWWWAFFVTSGILGNFMIRMAFAQNQTLSQLQQFSALLVLSDCLEVPAVLVAILLIDRVTRRQAVRRQMVSLGVGRMMAPSVAGR